YPQRRLIGRNANAFSSKLRVAGSLQAIAVFALASLAGDSGLKTRLFGNSLVQTANAMVKRL
ncbi:MAG TPA: hypothetical protein VE242_13605, partial [Chthoniobacterales bacterium]|nr:hypothetical protein [Chthoniobacterales bacterium]